MSQTNTNITALRKRAIAIFGIILCITGVLFWKTVLKGYIPFPGDNLIANYQPWRSYSFLGYSPGGYPSKDQYFDTIRQIYPWRSIVNEELKKGHIPLWNPYNFSGSPLMANGQSQVFYPPTLVYLFLPQKIAWTILVILQPLLAISFMYLYLKSLKLSTMGALFGGIAYGCSLFMTTFLEYNTIGHVICWLPLLLFCIHSFVESKKTRYLFFFLLAAVNTLLAGHLQIAVTICTFTGIYLVIFYLRNKELKLQFLLFLLTLLLSFGISAVQLLPTAELSSLSARSNHDTSAIMNRFLVQPKQLFMLLSQDIYGNPVSKNYAFQDSYPGKAISIGLIPLFFALLVVCKRKKEPVTKFFTGTAVVLFLILTANPLSRLLYSVNIPFLSASNPTNNLFLLSFALSVLAAIGITEWQKTDHNKLPIRQILGAVSIAFIALWGFYLTKYLPIQKNFLLLSTALFIVTVVALIFAETVKWKSKIFLLLFLLTVGELSFEFWKFNPFVPKELVFPDTPITSQLKSITDTSRIWGYGGASIEANFATQFGFFSPEGYDPLYPKRLGQLYASTKNGQVSGEFVDSNRSDATIVNGFGATDFSQNPYRKRLLQILATRWILDRTINGSTGETFPPTEFVLHSTEQDWKFMENKKALPHALLLPNGLKADSDTDAIQILYSNNFTPSQNLIIGPSTPLVTNTDATGSATITDYSPERVRIDVTTTKTQYLFLSDTFYPGWNAYIDDVKTPIYSGNIAFRSIIVPAGIHSVRFLYEPQSFKTGVIVSIISSLASGIVFAFLVLAKKKIKARK